MRENRTWGKETLERIRIAYGELLVYVGKAMELRGSHGETYVEVKPLSG